MTPLLNFIFNRLTVGKNLLYYFKLIWWCLPEKIVSHLSYTMLEIVRCALLTFQTSYWSRTNNFAKMVRRNLNCEFSLLLSSCYSFFFQMNHFLRLRCDKSLFYLPVYSLRPSVLFSFWILFKHAAYWGGQCITTAKNVKTMVDNSWFSKIHCDQSILIDISFACGCNNDLDLQTIKQTNL